LSTAFQIEQNKFPDRTCSLRSLKEFKKYYLDNSRTQRKVCNLLSRNLSKDEKKVGKRNSLKISQTKKLRKLSKNIFEQKKFSFSSL